jgi:hypothetical protein
MTWTLAHSIGMLLVVGAALAFGDARPIAAFGAASLAVLVSLCAHTWTPSGRFGAANTVTALRVFCIVGLAALPGIGPAASLTVVAIFALDGADGFLARRTGIGVLILLPGLYRYVYGVAISVLPSARGDAPRWSFFGSHGGERAAGRESSYPE